MLNHSVTQNLVQLLTTLPKNLFTVQHRYDVVMLKEQEIDLALERICLHETYDTAVSAIWSLDELYSFFLYCLYVMEMDAKEIAIALSRKPGSVRQQITRGQKN